MYKLSIELLHSTHRLEKQFISEDAARADAEDVFAKNQGLIRSVGLFFYAYLSQHNPKLVDTYDGQWSADYYADEPEHDTSDGEPNARNPSIKEPK